MALKSQKMNLDYIRTFVVLAQSHNMYEASRKLDVDASYVSRHIKRLEEELNTKLILPTPKNKDLKLTKEGTYFFQKYEKIYNEILLTEKEYLQNQDLDNCQLTIGVSQDLELSVLSPKLIEFHQKYPNVALKIISGDTEFLINQLSQYNFDIILDKFSPMYSSKMLEIETKKIYDSNYCLVYKEDLPEKEIWKLPFILATKRKKERELIDRYLKEKKISLNIKYQMEDLFCMLSCIKEGYGASILLKEAVAKEPSLKAIDLDLPTGIYLSYTRQNLTKTTEEFSKLFLQE